MYVTAPVTGSTLTVPFEGPDVIVTLVGSIGPSKSVSFGVITSITTGLSSVVVAVSLFATGASLTGLTVKVMFAVSHNTGVPASHNVYGIVATPLKFGAGSNVTTPVVES